MCDYEKEIKHIGYSEEIGSDHVFNGNMDPKNHPSNNQDTSGKIVSTTGQGIADKAANLLLQCATHIEEMIKNYKTDTDNNLKNGHKSNDSVAIKNNMIMANHDSKNNTDAKDCVTLNKHVLHDAVNNNEVMSYGAKNNHEIVETHETLVSHAPTDKDVNVVYMTSVKDPHKETHMAMFDHMTSSFVKVSHVHVFECDFCSSLFASKSILKEHQRKYYKKTILAPIFQNRPNHDPSKPYHCKVCGWSYRQISTLKAHLAIHKPAPHACECGVAFYREDDLYSHRKLLSH